MFSAVCLSHKNFFSPLGNCWFCEFVSFHISLCYVRKKLRDCVALHWIHVADCFWQCSHWSIVPRVAKQCKLQVSVRDGKHSVVLFAKYNTCSCMDHREKSHKELRWKTALSHIKILVCSFFAIVFYIYIRVLKLLLNLENYDYRGVGYATSI